MSRTGWLKAALGFVTPLVVYAAWYLYVSSNADRLAAEQAAQPNPGPDSAGAMYFFFMLFFATLCGTAIMLLIAGILCIDRTRRAFGIGMAVGAVLPVVVVYGYMRWIGHQLQETIVRSLGCWGCGELVLWP